MKGSYYIIASLFLSTFEAVLRPCGSSRSSYNFNTPCIIIISWTGNILKVKRSSKRATHRSGRLWPDVHLVMCSSWAPGSSNTVCPHRSRGQSASERHERPFSALMGAAQCVSVCVRRAVGAHNERTRFFISFPRLSCRSTWAWWRVEITAVMLQASQIHNSLFISLW